MKDQCNDLKVVNALTAAVRTADANGASVDRAGFESVTFAVNLGAEGDTLTGALYIQLEVEESDDNAAWTDCAAADIIVPKSQSVVLTGVNSLVFTADDGAEAPAVFHFGYKGEKRYARVVYNVTGTHVVGTPCAAIAILGNPAVRPVQA